MPHIRIFPHNVDDFPTMDALQTWLMTALVAQGGRYLLPSRNLVAELPTGSIVLFRYANDLLGEGVVREYQRAPRTERTPPGQEQGGACVTFAPGSIRLFAPPIAMEEAQRIVGVDRPIMVEGGYFIIPDWHVYPRLLALHIGGPATVGGRSGAFI